MNGIQIHFSKTVNDYDTVAEKVVFKNDELHTELVGAISFHDQSELDVLDLGCGTGHGMQSVVKKFPNAYITGIDFSPLMIERARVRLAPYSDRVALCEADFNEYPFPRKHDVVLSAFAVHNIAHEQKESLFKKIYDSLKPGGLFINGDFYEHEMPALNDALKQRYRKYLVENLSGAELEVWLRHAFQEDMPMSLTRQSQLLRAAGFKDAELVWLYNNEAVYCAKK
jgi:tRNA (cmo5U34)-methyltransferase